MLGKALVSGDTKSKYLIVYSELLKYHLKKQISESHVNTVKGKRKKEGQVLSSRFPELAEKFI